MSTSSYTKASVSALLYESYQTLLVTFLNLTLKELFSRSLTLARESLEQYRRQVTLIRMQSPRTTMSILVWMNLPQQVCLKHLQAPE